ncbi:MAG TPA: MOP flippase family protein [Candidatus Polarisedimenticolia bacterium]
MSEPAEEIRRAAAGGVVWTATSQAVRQVLQVAVTAILARYLVPEDFGMIGMAAVTLAFVAPLNEMGMGAALIQRKDLSPRHATAVFWSQIAMASAVAALMAAGAPIVAGFFKRPDLVPLLRLMCWNLPVGAAASAPQALLARRLSFGRIAAVETISLAGAGAIAAAMAVTGWGVWSLAGQALAGTAITTILVIPMSGISPLSRADRPTRAHLMELARFSAPLTGYQLLNFLSRNIDDILIGRFLGAEALGFYQMAYRVMMYPLQKVSGIVGRVSFPAFASMQDDTERIRRGYLRTVRYIALVTFPMMAAVMVAAPELTGVLFGPAWAPVASLIVVLSLAGMAGSIGTTVGSLFLSRGRSDLMLKWELVASTCYAAAIAFGLMWGLMGVAVSYTITALILWPISHVIANRLIDLPMKSFFHALVPQALLAVSLASVLLAVKVIWLPAEPVAQAAFLVSCAAIGAGALACAAWAGRPAAAAEALALVREAFSGMRRSGRRVAP